MVRDGPLKGGDLWYGPYGTWEHRVMAPQALGNLRSCKPSRVNSRMLGASAAVFFFKRGHDTRSNAKKLFATIAYQLAFAVPCLRASISAVVGNDPAVIVRSIATQMKMLISEPWHAHSFREPIKLEGHHRRYRIVLPPIGGANFASFSFPFIACLLTDKSNIDPKPESRHYLIRVPLIPNVLDYLLSPFPCIPLKVPPLVRALTFSSAYACFTGDNHSALHHREFPAVRASPSLVLFFPESTHRSHKSIDVQIRADTINQMLLRAMMRPSDIQLIRNAGLNFRPLACTVLVNMEREHIFEINFLLSAAIS
ncbi:hypothetical protein B0H19DRAFT_1276729 [Mycena capillaripes]|nr:hypothetical protein B0H19DRAFT_1276729 [Mycena capillaripes]